MLLAAAAQKVTLTAKYVGTRANGFTATKRVSLLDPTKNEILLHEGATLLETIAYTPGADEAAAIVAAVNASSSYVDAKVEAAGAVDAVSQAPLAAGASATVNGAALTAALAAVDTLTFDVLVTDVEDAPSHTTITAHVLSLRNSGKRVMAVIGEPVSVAIATRRANSAATNREFMVYVGNGFREGTTDVDGAEAAGRVAGRVASLELTESLTFDVVEGATDIVGLLSNLEVEQAVLSGMLVFTKDPNNRPQIEYGITTLVEPGDNLDAGWKKIRRTRTRDRLMTAVTAAQHALLGRVNNDPNGRASLRMAAQTVVDAFIAAGALNAGAVIEDPAQAAAGDSAWWAIETDDNDSVEKSYDTFGFRFNPAA